MKALAHHRDHRPRLQSPEAGRSRTASATPGIDGKGQRITQRQPQHVRHRKARLVIVAKQLGVPLPDLGDARILTTPHRDQIGKPFGNWPVIRRANTDAFVRGKAQPHEPCHPEMISGQSPQRARPVAFTANTPQPGTPCAMNGTRAQNRA